MKHVSYAHAPPFFLFFLCPHHNSEVFKYVQVVAAICDAFAHGANDVANTVAPFEIIYIIYVDGRIQTDRALLGATEYP